MELLKNKTAVITGAAKGIGESVARVFEKNGAGMLFLVDLDEAALKAAAEDIGKDSACRCVPVKADVSKEEQAAAVFEEVRKHTDKLDILVNSAGICRIVDIDDMTMKSWDLTLDVNLKGPFLFAREALKMMKKNKYGRIVNIASQAGKIGGLMVGMDYSSSKAGLLCLTKSLAKSSAQYGITVNSVAPGLISTEMTSSFGYDPQVVPLKRIGTPQEVADTVLFLASDLSRYMTGACLDVNGGMTMW